MFQTFIKLTLNIKTPNFSIASSYQLTMAATTTQTEEHVSLKLLLSEKGDKVLFAEAGKDFVDVLCSFLTMPLGTIARLVEKESSIGPVTVGCLNSLYRSVVDLDEDCMSSHTIKQMLLKPTNFAEDYCNTLELNIEDTPPSKYFMCNNYKSSYCTHDFASSMNKDIKNCYCGCSISFLVFPEQFDQGFVNDVATFVITDDLIIMPNSIDYASFGLLQEFGIENTSSVKEMILKVTIEKVLDLLKCSLLSKSTLTDFFLGKKPSLEVSRFFSYDVEIGGNIQINLKLVIRKSDGKILCAQGEQDFADLLLSFLTIPLGGISRILGEKIYLGSINRFYKSIADLNENKYFISEDAKNRIVDPCIFPLLKLSKQIFPILERRVHEYYWYYSGSSLFVQFSKPGEDKSYAGKFKRINFSNMASHEGYVKGPAMYVATDDLAIAPLSPISALGLLNRLKTPLKDLKEKHVTIGVKESLNILKAALTSTSALTNGLAHLLTEVKEEK
ncbi:hypothetical protein MtrunA17_Chr7g0239921 [Medicago truncatula]|uniref:DUF674 family protein n=1 Tax=Medicago truncatula TaxID=3880 RepID=A0A396H0F9_MEDTR|nr:hypothetical protein MtrunA17_Chr7g0239921 [Medicago truncatula]